MYTLVYRREHTFGENKGIFRTQKFDLKNDFVFLTGLIDNDEDDTKR